MPYVEPGSEFQDETPQYQPPTDSGDSFSDTLRYVRQRRREYMEKVAARKAERAGGEVVKDAGETAVKTIGKKGLIAGEKKVAQKVGQQAVSQVGKTVAKKGASMAARWGAEAATGAADAGISWAILAADIVISSALYIGKKYGGYIIVGLAVLLMMPVIVLSILFFKTGLSIFPSSGAEKTAASALATLAGSAKAGAELIVKVGEYNKDRLGRIQTTSSRIEGISSPITQRIISDKKKIEALRGQYTAEKNTAQRIKLLKESQEIQKKLEAELPFGKWVAQTAESRIGNSSDTFCRITKAAATVGCASFVSMVLYDVGVPQEPTATTLDVWNNPRLVTVVARPNQLNRNLFQENKNNLHPGDIVWWGDGARARATRYSDAQFDHMGIYLGNGKVAENSSSKKRVVRSSIEKSKQPFNGAKRYGK